MKNSEENDFRVLSEEEIRACLGANYKKVLKNVLVFAGVTAFAAASERILNDGSIFSNTMFINASLVLIFGVDLHALKGIADALGDIDKYHAKLEEIEQNKPKKKNKLKK